MESNFINELLYFNTQRLQNISINDINKVPLFRQKIKICIFNNKIYLMNGLKGEERHEWIINILKELLVKYKIPNLLANFVMMDSNKFNGAYFSNTDCVRDNNPLKILIPGWSFNKSTTGSMGEFEKYGYCMNDILNESLKNKWCNRINKLIYRGHIITPHRNLIVNELIKKFPEKMLHIHIPSFDPEVLKYNPMSMKDLCKYKYQLLLNGHGSKIGNESGSIRPKYMLATGSICIYITLNTDVYEWWSSNKDLCPYLNVCKNIDEAIEKIKYFENNEKETEIFLVNQLKFVKTVLIDGFEEYYYKMLCNYASRLDFSVISYMKIIVNIYNYI